MLMKPEKRMRGARGAKLQSGQELLRYEYQMTRCEYGIANHHKGAGNSQLPLGQSFNRNVNHHHAPLAIATKCIISQEACSDDQSRPTLAEKQVGKSLSAAGIGVQMEKPFSVTAVFWLINHHLIIQVD